MTLSPGERKAIEDQISAEQKHIQQKQERLAKGVGPLQRVEIERDIQDSEGLIRGWINQLRMG